MKILTVENQPYDLNYMLDEIDDVRYCVLDAADKAEVDFYFLPLIFLESFHAPAICMKIGEYEIQMPMDWSILICDDEYSALEVINLASLNNRGFRGVTMNPMKNNGVKSEEIQITNVYSDVKWFFPKLKHGHVLAVPLEDKPDPKCAYFVKELNKVCPLDIGDIM